MNNKWGLYTRVVKAIGYPFPGIIVAVFTTMAGETRYVVEHECGGLLHIFNGNQLRKSDEETPTKATI